MLSQQTHSWVLFREELSITLRLNQILGSTVTDGKNIAAIPVVSLTQSFKKGICAATLLNSRTLKQWSDTYTLTGINSN